MGERVRMNVSFTYTYSDYAALTKAMEKHGRFAKYSMLIGIIIVLLNVAASAFFIFETLSAGGALKLVHFANAGLAMLIIVFIYVLKPLYLKHYYKKQMIDGKLINLAFSNQGLAVDMPSFNGTHDWQAIIRADEEPEHFLLWINKVQAYCVPKRGFSSTDDIENFKTLVAEKVPNQEVIK
jgi:hypothetical protein